MTAKQAILERLKDSPEPLAVHQLLIVGVSENAAATRLSELARAGLVVGVVASGKSYKVWAIVPVHAQAEGA